MSLGTRGDLGRLAPGRIKVRPSETSLGTPHLIGVAAALAVQAGSYHGIPGAAAQGEGSLESQVGLHGSLALGAEVLFAREAGTRTVGEGVYGQLEVGWLFPVGPSWRIGPELALERARFRASTLSGYTALAGRVRVGTNPELGRIRHASAAVGWGAGSYRACYCGWSFLEASGLLQLDGGWFVTADASRSRAAIGWGRAFGGSRE